jgi:hypothetical protein
MLVCEIGTLCSPGFPSGESFLSRTLESSREIDVSRSFFFPETTVTTSPNWHRRYYDLLLLGHLYYEYLALQGGTVGVAPAGKLDIFVSK